VTCAGKQTQPRDAIWSLTSGGLLRFVNVHVPASYDPARGTPVVLDFHGFTSDAVQEVILSGMAEKADAEGFISMQPLGIGIPRSWNAGACCGLAVATEVDDIAFVRAILDEAAEKLCVDPRRVFATGMSNGGFFSHRLGCELSDRIAAIAPVAGTMGMTSCAPPRPVPVIAFNGTADPLVPYAGSVELGFEAVETAFAGWAARDGCAGAPVETFAQGDARCLTHASCASGAAVTQCTIDGGGHTWPGGLPIPPFGHTSTDLSATDAMWAFFIAHPMP
jgi:polyhydroxybutyrate depolymerase